MKTISLYTDGACQPNPGFGGWGAIMFYKDKKKVFSGFSEETTNNIMELTAVINPLSRLKEPCLVYIYTDSKYVVNGASDWMYGWARNKWISSTGFEVKNKEFWLKLFELNKIHSLKWTWVKGHANNVFNNECDLIATTQISLNKSADYKRERSKT